MPESAFNLFTVPNLVLAAFLLLTLGGGVALLRSLVRWYLGLSAIEEALLRLERRVKKLQDLLEEESEDGADDPPRGPTLPRPGEEDRGLPGPRG